MLSALTSVHFIPELDGYMHGIIPNLGIFSWDVNRLKPFWSFLHYIGLYGWIINVYFSSNMGSTPFMTHVSPLAARLRDLTRFNVPPSNSQWIVACRLAVTVCCYWDSVSVLCEGGDVNMIPYLGCGFKYFLFSPPPGEMIQFDSYFSNALKPPTSYSIWYSTAEFASIRCQ